MFARPSRLIVPVILAAALGCGSAFAAETAAASCGGVSLVAKAKAEQPERYAAFAADGAKVPNAEGLLWRIEGKGGAAPSYLFGTMHTTEPDLVALGEPVREALKQAKSVAVELADASSPSSQAEMTAYITSNAIDMAGAGLDGLTQAQSDEAKRRLGEAGMPAHVAPLLKPWFLAMTLQISACELRRMAGGSLTIDGVIEKAGRDAGAKVVGLETITEQLDSVSKISEQTARKMIRDTVATPETADDMLATTLALYRARTVGWIYAMKPDVFGPAFDLSAYADFLEEVVDRRNRLMLDRARPLVDKGDALIAVGALHLPGKKGLVELFRNEGYTLSKIW